MGNIALDYNDELTASGWRVIGSSKRRCYPLVPFCMARAGTLIHITAVAAYRTVSGVQWSQYS